MNIKEAKEQIKNAITAYFTKDESGDYIVPIERQRPVFLMGPPGIGKTAVMEQIASEMGVGILSYSMTHHTRQSALGLPFIEHKVYQGVEYDISEYTMSEIIASVYELMEKTGVREGILFLDEINCVSETLSPIMLQFLQYKVFGRHRVPEGWIVVTAGNPPEYNNSVREFDIVTWDRLKRIDVEPDFNVWKEYAFQKGIHPAVLTYLEIKGDDFYKVESTVDGKKFITARGWDDLSQMIQLYEMNDIPVDEKLICQYIQNPRIAGDFASYYVLFNKYKNDYQIDKILEGKESQSIDDRAREAKFDERLSLIGMLLDKVAGDIKLTMRHDASMTDLVQILRKIKISMSIDPSEPAGKVKEQIEDQETELEIGKNSGQISRDDIEKIKMNIAFLKKILVELQSSGIQGDAFKHVSKAFEQEVKALKKNAASSGKKLSNMFKFLEQVFDEGQEILIVVTELTSNIHTSRFIGKYGCKEYFNHNKNLLLYERQEEISKVLEDFEL